MEALAKNQTKDNREKKHSITNIPLWSQSIPKQYLINIILSHLANTPNSQFREKINYATQKVLIQPVKRQH